MPQRAPATPPVGLALCAMTRFTLVACALVLSLLTACSRSPAPPPAETLTVAGTPAAIYEAILPEIRDRVAQETKIVRVDSATGAITMRFSAYLEDHSVRLVEVGLTPESTGMTLVTIVSRRFSFMPGRQRDAQDADLEHALADLVRRRTAAASAAPMERAD